MEDLKTIWHLFYTTWSFVHHSKAIGEFKLEWQSGNAQLGSKSAMFCPMWPWNLMDDLKKTIWHYFKAIGEFKLEKQSGNAQLGSKLGMFCPMWPWNLTDDLEKNNRAAPLYYIKLCALFQSPWWIQTVVTVWKRSTGVKIDDFSVPCDLERWPLTDVREKL